jgi:predicted acyltransferase
MSEPSILQKSPARLLSLDVFRGLTVAAMILVNNPGSWSHIYGPLKHADWHGCTPTDLIFPFFLFIVGVSISYALGSKKGNVKDSKLLYPVLAMPT